MEYFIDVVLPIPLEKLFTYRISAQESAILEIGMRVAVPFGKSKIYTALVYSKHNKAPEVYEPKEIHQIIDETPIVTKVQLQHWQWIANYYMCTLGEVIRSALPSAFLLESETLILPNKVDAISEAGLKDEEYQILEALKYQSTLKISEVIGIIDRKNVLPIINSLVKKNLIQLKEEVYEQYKPKLIKYVRLGESYNSEEKLEALLNLSLIHI